MKAWSVIGLLFAAAVLATIPVSGQVTPRGVELSVDQAQAVTYRRARVTARRGWHNRRAPEQRDELAPSDHSITSSAVASSVGGTVRPSALAVLRLMTSSTFADCWTGKSAGFSPLRIRPV
jgi:hypothetical protein